MEKIKLIITARIEEVPTIGQFTIDSYKSDIADFQAYKPNKYVASFLTDLETKKSAVEGIVNPVILTNKIKVVTERIAKSVAELREPMNFLEGYVADAQGLTVAPSDFGISQVRKKVNTDDVEGLNYALATVLTNIDENMAALTDVGYTAAMRDDLKDLKKSIFDDNAAQNALMEERGQLVVNNIGVINDFLKDIKAIWADGKALFKVSNPVKMKDYTNAELIRRIRNDELHTLICGKVIDNQNQVAAGAKIVARPSVEGKRGKTVYSNDVGFYELKGLKPVSYLLTVTLKNGHVFIATATAMTNETVMADLKEE